MNLAQLHFFSAALGDIDLLQSQLIMTEKAGNVSVNVSTHI